jgi:hypothetical protein
MSLWMQMYFEISQDARFANMLGQPGELHSIAIDRILLMALLKVQRLLISSSFMSKI